MKEETITLLGVGDILIDREKPETIFQHVAEVLRSADITFGNCEGAFSDKGSPNPKQAAYSSPKNIAALLHASFDVISLANNHSLDWGREALLDSMPRLKEVGLSYAGAGRNLAEARQPVILERKGTKVGFLAYSSVHPEGYEAEENKPGVVPLRAWTFYDKIVDEPAPPPRIISIPCREDLAAMIDDIKRLRAKVDVVVISFHWGLVVVPRIIPMYCIDAGHVAIDAGADLILGTHSHRLKGIEVYKGKVIFYSTGDFGLELGRHFRDHEHVISLNEHYRITDDTDRRYTLIAKAIIEAGKIKVSYIPCWINEQSEPEIVPGSDPRGQAVFNYVEDVSRSEGLPVHFSWDGDEVLITP